MTETSQFTHGYALLVGVGADLSVTIDDAVAIRDILTDPNRCAYPGQNVRLLAGENATRAIILEGMEWLAGQVGNDATATAVVYFSGHGGYMPEYHLVPFGYNPQDIDGTAISGDEFSAKLDALNSQKLLVLLDCCHAGGMAEIKTTGYAKSPIPPQIDDILTRGSGRAVIASSRKDEVSYTSLPYSHFTLALREGLSGYGAAERDGYAYLADVALYVGRMVANRTRDKQHPILKLSAADNFPIAYYAGGASTPKALPESTSHPTPYEAIDIDMLAGYRRIFKRYQQNLLVVEERMSEFYDQAAVPLDLERTKDGILRKIEQIETKIEEQAQASGWSPPP